ncbi:hypothetical protein ADL21_02835 [Streptomyces albus subsp. albus]|nr:hypothetical protein ADL21_02835 [Streptomyces albus subsp. albus]
MGALGAEVATGGINGAAASVPAALRGALRAAADHAFSTGMRTAFIVGACVAFLGAIAGFALIRRPQAGATVKSADRRPLADAQAF